MYSLLGQTCILTWTFKRPWALQAHRVHPCRTQATAVMPRVPCGRFHLEFCPLRVRAGCRGSFRVSGNLLLGWSLLNPPSALPLSTYSALDQSALWTSDISSNSQDSLQWKGFALDLSPPGNSAGIRRFSSPGRFSSPLSTEGPPQGSLSCHRELQ